MAEIRFQLLKVARERGLLAGADGGQGKRGALYISALGRGRQPCLPDYRTTNDMPIVDQTVSFRWICSAAN